MKYALTLVLVAMIGMCFLKSIQADNMMAPADNAMNAMDNSMNMDNTEINAEGNVAVGY